MITIKRNCGLNRGKRRLWIEGKALIEAGLPHGTRWDLVPFTGLYTSGFYITANPDGARKVSGKPERPVIDISGRTLDIIPDATAFALSYGVNSGCIKVTQYEV